jgi:hypothetical protein
LAVLADVSFFFIPDILAQNDFFVEQNLSSVFGLGAGGLSPGLPGLAAL